jgi:thiol-disulfide isomerase/thioredoxin
MDPSAAKVIILVFAMQDCPACHEYMPRFQTVAGQFADRIPYQILDANAPANQQIAERFGIEATPTTMVLRKPVGAIKAEGALSDQEILRLFNVASAAI